MWFLDEIIGVVCIAGLVLPKFITKDMQKGILAKSLLSGSFPFAKIVITINIFKKLTV